VEVDISHSESVSFDDNAILASVCANSLSVFKAARTAIDDYALIALETQCHNLTVLDVEMAVEEDFLEDRRGCPALRSLNISFLPEVTDYSILAIAGLSFDEDYGILHAKEGGMMQLESLDIRGTGSSCEAVTDFVTHLPRLKEVAFETA
jgi:hypothetical protein